MRFVLSQNPTRSVGNARVLFAGRMLSPSLQKPLLFCLVIVVPQPWPLQLLEGGGSVTGNACPHAGGTEGGSMGGAGTEARGTSRIPFAEAWSGALVQSPEMGREGI